MLDLYEVLNSMNNNFLSDLFSNQTELTAIDHFMQLMVKTNSFNQQVEVLEKRVQDSESKISTLTHENQITQQLNQKYKSEIEDLNKKVKEAESQKSKHDELLYGVWTDSHTGLMWARISIGQEWRDGAVIGDAEEMTWLDAVPACKKFNLGGFSNWRLPTIEELKTLMLYSNSGYNCPKSTLFKPVNNEWGKYFSVTYFGVCFDKGDIEVYDDGFDENWYVRPVRNIKV